jgi:asparagine synthase (glutamine-hydrolysing)
MARQSDAPVKTFSIGFEEAEFNELPHAEEVARYYGTDHHAILVRPDSLSLVARVISHFDEPIGDSAAIPTFLVSQFARPHVTVCLTGDGGDELFGGYESFFQVQQTQWMDRVPRLARRLVSWVADSLPYSAYGKNFLRMASRGSSLERYIEANTMPYFLRRRLLGADWILPSSSDFFYRTFPDCVPVAAAGILAQAMYFEATAKLTGNMLVKADRMSMANSLEVRCPLLDVDVAALAAAIPHSLKIQGGKGKRILLKAFADRLPPGILARKKMGFGFPLSIWFRGPLREFLWDHLTSSKLVENGMIRGDFLPALLAEHQSGRRDNSHWLWQLLVLDLWFRDFEQTHVSGGPLTETAPCR